MFFTCSPGFARSAVESMGRILWDTSYESTKSHTLGYAHSEWMGAGVFFVLLLVTLQFWSTGIAWYLKPLINLIAPIVVGVAVQILMSFREMR